MQAIAGVSAVAAVFVLAAGAGCRKAYLVDSAALVSAAVAQNVDTARQQPLGPLVLAVPVQEKARAGAQPEPEAKPVRVRLWALSVDEAVPGTRYWRASAPRQRTYLTVGGSCSGWGWRRSWGRRYRQGCSRTPAARGARGRRARGGTCSGRCSSACRWGTSGRAGRNGRQHGQVRAAPYRGERGPVAGSNRSAGEPVFSTRWGAAERGRRRRPGGVSVHRET